MDKFAQLARDIDSMLQGLELTREEGERLIELVRMRVRQKCGWQLNGFSERPKQHEST